MLKDTRSAALRAYCEMRERGLSEICAFKTAIRVCHYRLPDVPYDDARFLVADWVSESLGQ
jgi:hypothetical protein